MLIAYQSQIQELQVDFSGELNWLLYYVSLALLVVSSRCISQRFIISTNFKPEPIYSMTIGWG